MQELFLSFLFSSDYFSSKLVFVVWLSRKPYRCVAMDYLVVIFK